MRNISSEGLAKLATRLGTEPIIILEVNWVSGVTASFYADRDLGSIPGKILSVGSLDNVVGVSNNTSSQSLEVTLDDTDGSIKQIFNNHDIHKRNVRVWQTFDGLDLSDKFLLFSGKVSSPIVWNESDRTIRFTIISQLEDKEIGFSAEEGQFPALPVDMVGKAWPMLFGRVIDSPALQITKAITGTTLNGVGMVDGAGHYADSPLYSDGNNTDSGASANNATLGAQLTVLWCAVSHFDLFSIESQQYLDQINALMSSASITSGAAAAKTACAKASRAAQIAEVTEKAAGANPVQILGGEDFPQGQEVTVEINDMLLDGVFTGQSFAYYNVRPGPGATLDDTSETANCNANQGSGGTFDFRIDLPDGTVCREHGFYFSTGAGSAGMGIANGGSSGMQQLWADAGAEVHLYSNEPMTYIVSITPGTVLAVKAFKQYTGERRLVDVPSDLYTVSTQNFGSVTAVTIVVNRPLGTLYNQGWSDDLYVTFEADAPTYGPNIVDILIHLINTYTDLSYDAASFAYAKTKLTPFPANFPILDRKNTLQVLQEIAYQARCALWINNGIFYIKYLPEEPSVTAANTILVSDLDSTKGVEVELTPTEDLVTKMIISWRISWAPGQNDRVRNKVDPDKSEKKMILRHNVTRYGIQEEEYNWYIYNQPDIIFKCATFWLIRKSHTWKRIKFTTFLQKLNLETFDPVNLEFAGGYVANGSIKALVEQANYNSEDNTIDFECLVPVKAGTMTKYDFFWPSALPKTALWPPAEDEESNDCGGGGIGMDASGDLPIGLTPGTSLTDVVWVGGPNILFRGQSDVGDRHPTDTDFVASTLTKSSNGTLQWVTQKPSLDLKGRSVDPSPIVPPNEFARTLVIDIAKTTIIDSSSPTKNHAVLKSVLYGINNDGNLQLNLNTACADADHPDTKAQLSDVVGVGKDKENYLCLLADTYVSDGEHDKEFDFKFDSEGDKFGAGTAFLKAAQ